MRFSLSFSIAILAIFASVQAKEPEAADEGKNQVQADHPTQSKIGIPTECLGAQGEKLKECLDNTDLEGPGDAEIEV